MALTAVKLTDSFWAPRLRINRDVTLPTQYQLLEETGRIDNMTPKGRIAIRMSRNVL